MSQGVEFDKRSSGFARGASCMELCSRHCRPKHFMPTTALIQTCTPSMTTQSPKFTLGADDTLTRVKGRHGHHPYQWCSTEKTFGRQPQARCCQTQGQPHHALNMEPMGPQACMTLAPVWKLLQPKGRASGFTKLGEANEQNSRVSKNDTLA